MDIQWHSNIPGLHSGDVVALVALGEHEDGGTPCTLASRTTLGWSGHGFSTTSTVFYLRKLKLWWDLISSNGFTELESHSHVFATKNFRSRAPMAEEPPETELIASSFGMRFSSLDRAVGAPCRSPARFLGKGWEDQQKTTRQMCVCTLRSGSYGQLSSRVQSISMVILHGYARSFWIVNRNLQISHEKMKKTWNPGF